MSERVRAIARFVAKRGFVRSVFLVFFVAISVQLWLWALWAAGRSTLPKVQAALLTGMLAALSLTGCGHSNSISKPLVTDVAQSSVKRQSIGNCWIYAEASWLEAEIKTATGTTSRSEVILL